MRSAASALRRRLRPVLTRFLDDGGVRRMPTIDRGSRALVRPDDRLPPMQQAHQQWRARLPCCRLPCLWWTFWLLENPSSPPFRWGIEPGHGLAKGQRGLMGGAQLLSDYRRSEGQDRGAIDVDCVYRHGLYSTASLSLWTGISVPTEGAR